VNDKRISKFISLVLRHDPSAAGLELSADGWAEVDALIAGASAKGIAFDRATLERIVAESDKQRFAFDDTGTRIRANQGHSVAVDLALEPVEPPEILFHGTVERFWDAIREEGLKPGSRQHVHLSPDEATAHKVGQRRGRPFILRVRAGDLHRAGHPFFCSANGVWLTDTVPPTHLEPI